MTNSEYKMLELETEEKKKCKNCVKVNHVKTPDYLTSSKLPASDYVINPYIGCPHACKYCYGVFMKRFTGHNDDWGNFIDIKTSEKEINLKKIDGKKVFLSSVTDCYNIFEEEYEVTRKILEQLVESNCALSISTKSHLVLRDLDILKRFKKLTVAISLNTLDNDFRNDMDNASSVPARMYTLRELHKNGIKTVLFMSPIFPHITDFKAIVEKTKDFVDEYWFENLNLRGSYKKVIMEYIYNNYPDYYHEYENIYLKNDKTYWKELSNEIEDYCKINNIKYINYFYHEELVKNKGKI